MAPWKCDLSEFDLETQFDTLFEIALRDVNVESSVGHCAMSKFGATIGEALGYYLDEKMRPQFDESRVSILKYLTYQRLLNPHEADNIKVFIKQEPHKISKLVEGRYRLISAVSLIDTMTDRIMFGWLQKKVMSTVCQTPVMVGWSPVAGGYRFLTQKFNKCRTRGLDKTAWDWTCGEWVMKTTLKVLQELALNAPGSWTRWTNERWIALFRDAHFQFSDGTVVQQPGWGVMKSGCYLTIILNSIGQLIHHHLALQFCDSAPTNYVVLGDDVTLNDFESFPCYAEIIAKNGALLKPSEPTECIEFAGWAMSDHVVIPEYWQKHLYHITHVGPELLPEVLEAYLILYAFDENFNTWLRRTFAAKYPRWVRSLNSCQTIMRGK